MQGMSGNGGTKTAFDQQLICGTIGALRHWLLTSASSPYLLFKPFPCKACPEVYPFTKNCLFVLPKKRSEHVFSMLKKARGSIFSEANLPIAFRPGPPCPIPPPRHAAPHPDPPVVLRMPPKSFRRGGFKPNPKPFQGGVETRKRFRFGSKECLNPSLNQT